jgi:serine acetyltransferase
VSPRCSPSISTRQAVAVIGKIFLDHAIIHPSAVISKGILLDHAISVVLRR